MIIIFISQNYWQNCVTLKIIDLINLPIENVKIKFSLTLNLKNKKNDQFD